MIFKKDPAQYRAQFERDGYALLKDVLALEFVSYLSGFLAKSAAGHAEEFGKGRIAGKKQQYLFDFPSKGAGLKIRAGIAKLTGMREEDITISERHLKVYDETAQPWPAPHKDRHASTVSIGLPVALSEGSSVCVFPDLDRAPNMEEKAVFMLANDLDEIERLYASDDAKMLHEELGDMIVFLGSTIFHERVKPAGTSVLYLKLNDKGWDPLGENIYGEEKELAAA